jgi:hypothetical protein
MSRHVAIPFSFTWGKGMGRKGRRAQNGEGEEETGKRKRKVQRGRRQNEGVGLTLIFGDAAWLTRVRWEGAGALKYTWDIKKYYGKSF